MKVFRIRIDGIHMLPKDEFLEIAEFDENKILSIVNRHLSNHSLLLSKNSALTYTWHNNTLHVTGVAYFDDPDAPLMTFL